MNEFLDTAYDLWRVGAIQKPADDCFKAVFQAIAALQAVHSKSQLDLNNIESVFTTCEMAKTLSRFPGKEDRQIEDLIRALKVLIVHTLEKTVRFPCEGNEIKSPLPYDEFVRLLQHLKGSTRPSHRVSVITFNYDIALDYALYRNGLPVDYGLDDRAPVEESVPLLKLHKRGQTIVPTHWGWPRLLPFANDDEFGFRAIHDGRIVFRLIRYGAASSVTWNRSRV